MLDYLNKHSAAEKDYAQAMQLDPHRLIEFYQCRAEARARVGDTAGSLADCYTYWTVGLNNHS